MWLTYAILAAICFGLRGSLYHWTSQRPLSRNLMLFGVFTSGAIINLTFAIIYSSNWTTASLVGVMMGLFSFGANASMYKGFAEGKASLVAILTALPPVIVVILAALLWSELPLPMQWVAFIIIVAGILLVRYSNDITLKNLQGAQWGLLAMLLFAFNDLSGKWSTMLQAEIYPSMFFMFITGSLCFGIWWLQELRQQKAAVAAAASTTASMEQTAATTTSSTVSQGAIASGPESVSSEVTSPSCGSASPASSASTSSSTAAIAQWGHGKTFVTGLGVGITNAVGMILLLTAFQTGKAGLVSAVSAMNVLIVLLYTRFIVKDKFSKTEVAGIAIAIIGILLMRFFSA
ncbi:EamA family transporter [Paenibacillus yanchengensis]|uniref:EamA family transporter n=1 Tax=Paenibacillus yanchengensis TaxID=2035833 RepID=A0ABW4YMC5_9BACL